jgi:hypothetical protein
MSESNERFYEPSEPGRVRRDDEPEVEGHRVRRSDDEAERVRRDADEGPEVEGHRVRSPEGVRKVY